MDIEYFDHPYNQTLFNERCVEVALALKFIEEHPDFIEVGAVLPYYGYASNLVIDPFDPKGTDTRRIIECDVTGKNVISISTLEHIGVEEYGNEVLSDTEAIESLKQIIDQAENYFITIPIGYNHKLDEQLLELLEDLKCYGVIRVPRESARVPNWKKIYPVTHLRYKYHSPYPFANFVLIITNKTI